MKKILFLFAVIATVVFTSCSKEGKQGVAGKDGNANIINTSLTLRNWHTIWDDGTSYDYTDSISWTQIDGSILSNGVVLVYALESTDNNAPVVWYALPFSFSGRDNTTGLKYLESFSYSINRGAIKIECVGYDEISGSANILSGLNGVQIRIVVIPPSIMSKYPNTNWKNYKEVDGLVNTYRAE